MSGHRISKTVNGVETTYYYDGDQLVAQKSGNDRITFMFDANGSAFGFYYNNAPYFFIKNIQGDVTAITDFAGRVIGTYTYDAWGNLIESASDLSDEVAAMNPIRFRGYYYDAETGYYFLNSRYYDAEMGRFLNADVSVIAIISPLSLYDKNLYAYCDNNPVVRKDASGYAWETVFDVFFLSVSIVDLIYDPYDLWNWAGVIGDVIDLIPVVTGVGEITRSIKTVDYVIDCADSTVDFGKSANIAKVATSGSVNNIGKIGETLAGVSSKGKTKILVNGKYRIPDILNFDENILGEVKNVKYLSNTKQLRDFATYAAENDLKKVLYVRPDTKLTQSLKNMGWDIRTLW
ncbi:MAG: hypothetical protein IJO14_01930 [Clostridia bacterium]|nr:hypothetical protein [Clostridia bacterium]